MYRERAHSGIVILIVLVGLFSTMQLVHSATAYQLIPSQLSQDSGICPGFQSRLEVGEQGRVIPGTSPNNLRERPTTQADVLGQIPVGGVFDVLDGPRCANNITWWQVRYNGKTGWTGEGKGNEYWLEPYNMDVNGGGLNPTSPASHTESGRIPSDVLEGISFGLGGGGCEFECACYRPSEHDLNWVFEPSTGTIAKGNGFRFLSNETRWDSDNPAICSAEPALLNTAAAISPTGKTITPRILRDDSGGFSVYLPIEAFSVPGTWYLQVRSVKSRAEISSPSTPTIMPYSEGVWLGGYDPRERILVIADEGHTYEIQADARGYALGLTSGKIFIGEYAHFNSLGQMQFESFDVNNERANEILYNLYWGTADPGDTSCPGAPRSRMRIGHQGRVLPGEPNNLRTDPGTQSSKIGQMPSNATFDVIYGPECVNHIAWWLVEYNALVGWTAEGEDSKYWLEPVN